LGSDLKHGAKLFRGGDARPTTLWLDNAANNTILVEQAIAKLHAGCVNNVWRGLRSSH